MCLIPKSSSFLCKLSLGLHRVAPTGRRRSSALTDAVACYAASEQRLKFGLSEIPPGACPLKPGAALGLRWGYTLWLFNIAIENGPFIDGLPLKNGDFPWLC